MEFRKIGGRFETRGSPQQSVGASSRTRSVTTKKPKRRTEEAFFHDGTTLSCGCRSWFTVENAVAGSGCSRCRLECDVPGRPFEDRIQVWIVGFEIIRRLDAGMT